MRNWIPAEGRSRAYSVLSVTPNIPFKRTQRDVTLLRVKNTSQMKPLLATYFALRNRKTSVGFGYTSATLVKCYIMKYVM